MDAPWPVSTLKPNAARAEVVNDVDEVAQVAPQPVELPDDEGIPATQRIECGIESRPRVQSPGGAILVEPARGNASGLQRVALQIGALRPSAFDTRIWPISMLSP